VQQIGRRLCQAQPREIVVGNIVQRVLGILREVAEDGHEADATASVADGPLSEASTEVSQILPSTMAEARGIPEQADESGPSTPEMRSTIATRGREFNRSQSPAAALRAFSEQPLPVRPIPLTSYTTTYGPSNPSTMTSMFSLLSHPDPISRSSTPPIGGTPSAASPARQPGGLTSQLLSRLNNRPTGDSVASSSAASISGDLKDRDLKPDILSALDELLDEILQVDDQVSSYSHDYVHSDDVILTLGTSQTVLKFLTKAAHKQKITVVHIDSPSSPSSYSSYGSSRFLELEDLAPDPTLQYFHTALKKANITVIRLRPSDTFAIMSRITKVILPSFGVLANGALIAPAGSRNIAVCARAQSVPVVVVAGVYQLSPLYPFDIDGLIEIGVPGRQATTGSKNQILSYSAHGELIDTVSTTTPVDDYIPPENVGLYITNLGGAAPTYLYRIVADHYRPEDLHF
jgi:translation initiation factor eIF-2B subunit beta